MAENSNIEWCDHTFNPWRGCTKVSAGCAHCYAETLSKRNPKLLGEWGKGKPRVLASEEMWRQPLKWNAATEQDPFRECKACGWRGCAPFEWNRCASCESDLAGSPIARPRVFCASLADWLDDEVPIEWFKRLLKLIHETPNIDWLLLTKRPQNWRSRLEETDHDIIFDTGDFVASEWLAGRPPANVWLGTTVEDQVAADARIPVLLKIPAKVRFLSCEPLLGPVDLVRSSGLWSDLNGEITPGYQQMRPHVNWVIAGGESGPQARPMHPGWARSLRYQCLAAGVPFLFKQWGEWCPGHNEKLRMYHIPPDGILTRFGKKAAGRKLDGRTWDGFPRV